MKCFVDFSSFWLVKCFILQVQRTNLSFPSTGNHFTSTTYLTYPGLPLLQKSNIDPEWKKLLDAVGITNEQLKDENTATFIYDFVEKHGGIEEANRQLEEVTRKSYGPPPLSK